MAAVKVETMDLKVTKNLVYYKGKNYGVGEVIPGVDTASAKEFLELEVVEKHVAPKEEGKPKEGE